MAAKKLIPMNGKYCLDTNIIIALFARNENILTKLAQVEQVFISSTVLGELYYGALKSARVYENLRRIDDFAKGCTILDCDAETARVYGKIKVELTQKGKMIPDNDIWIAAVARQLDLIIVTKDQHFSVVEDLKIENW
jgi:tRNA(fMet)-specific endonuclease VapC